MINIQKRDNENRGMKDDDWNLLLRRIKEGRCTPFLGAGACSPYLPLSNQIAQELAKKYNYPLPDINNLPRVAQFLAIERGDSIFPKELVIEMFKECKTPNFRSFELPHSILAELPLPIYLTTNYDDFMLQALQDNRKKVEYEYCRWNKFILKEPLNIDEDFKPTVDNPLVYYLHGFWDIPESLVLTEDDYLDFLVNVSENIDHSLHHRIRRSMRGTSLIFIGYRLEDLSFRTIFRGLINFPEKNLRRISISVQLPPKIEQRKSIERSIDSLEKFISDTNFESELKNNVILLISDLKTKTNQSVINKEKKNSLYQLINSLELQLIKLTTGNSLKKKFIINIINLLQESIGLLPTEGEPDDIQAIRYLEAYYKEMDICIYWGDAKQFATELRQRWEEYNK
jgi:hypothetical protein